MLLKTDIFFFFIIFIQYNKSHKYISFVAFLNFIFIWSLVISQKKKNKSENQGYNLHSQCRQNCHVVNNGVI